MTREELKDVKLGDILIEGKDHFISVNRLLEDPENPDRVEYFEDDYYHEVNCEYLSKLTVDKDSLMIGDAIKFYCVEFPVYVSQIHSDRIFVKVSAEEKDVEITHLKDLKPIPLTDEILYKNGFDYVHGHCASLKDTGFFITMTKWYSHHEDLKYLKYNSLGEWTVCGSENVRIRFVHELQHAMRLYGLIEEAKNLKV